MVVQAAQGSLVCCGGWVGLDAEKAGRTQCPSQNILKGQLCLGVVGTEQQVRKAWILSWLAGVAYCRSGTHRRGTLLGPKGQTWH